MKSLLIHLFIASFFLPGNLQAQDEKEKDLPEEIPTVVKIKVFATEGNAKTNASSPVAECQGFVVESDGTILTSYDRLVNAKTGALYTSIEIEGLTGKPDDPRSASIIAVEPTLNFAILKTKASRSLKASRICARDAIVVGVPVHSIMGMKGKKPVFASGKITDLNSMECYQESMTATMLQAAIDIPDTALGGPVFNNKGEVVALHTGYRQSANEEHEGEEIEVGKIHILPIFLIFNIYESVKLKGNMKSPWTGFSVRALSEKEQEIFPQGRFLGGVAVDFVWKGSPADKLGIKVDDFLVGFSYYPTKTVAAFQKWLYMYGVDFKVKLHFLRDQKEYYGVDYKIEERPDSARPR
ncbi:MAG: S1-C subfamily serine protease [Verrucomicrobiales bacterium]|jgi:S1-C subfamily serine protease